MLMFISDIGTGYGWLLPILILYLAVTVVWQRKLMERRNRCIVCCAGQYLSLKYKEFPELCKWNADKKLTQTKLIKIMHLLKKVPSWNVGTLSGIQTIGGNITCLTGNLFKYRHKANNIWKNGWNSGKQGKEVNE